LRGLRDWRSAQDIVAEIKGGKRSFLQFRWTFPHLPERPFAGPNDWQQSANFGSRALKQTCFSHVANHKVPCRAPLADLEQIPQPTVIVNGVNDEMIASINAWHMVQNIPNAQLIVDPDAGHGAQSEFPDRYLKHAIQFPDAR
jgi:pimeloyl-ACP methyl ester carboxylesterase